MKKYVNGVYYDMTPEEVAAHQAEAKRHEVAEKYRPLTEGEVTAMLITAQINTLTVDDSTALRMKMFYPEWAVNVSYSVGYKVQCNGRLWRCVQAHTALTGWEPENAASLWEQVNVNHDGTLDDPVPYEGNMALTAGLHYFQDGRIYLCTRDTVNPVYNALDDLVGIYVEVV